MSAFGHPAGVAVGDVFASRVALARAGVHRPMQAGICGRPERSKRVHPHLPPLDLGLYLVKRVRRLYLSRTSS